MGDIVSPRDRDLPQEAGPNPQVNDEVYRLRRDGNSFSSSGNGGAAAGRPSSDRIPGTNNSLDRQQSPFARNDTKNPIDISGDLQYGSHLQGRDRQSFETALKALHSGNFGDMRQFLPNGTNPMSTRTALALDATLKSKGLTPYVTSNGRDQQFIVSLSDSNVGIRSTIEPDKITQDHVTINHLGMFKRARQVDPVVYASNDPSKIQSLSRTIKQRITGKQESVQPTSEVRTNIPVRTDSPTSNRPVSIENKAAAHPKEGQASEVVLPKKNLQPVKPTQAQDLRSSEVQTRAKGETLPSGFRAALDILPLDRGSDLPQTGELPQGVFAPVQPKEIPLPKELANGKAGVDLHNMVEVSYPVGKLEIGYNKAGEQVLIRSGDGTTQIKLGKKDLTRLGVSSNKTGWYQKNNETGKYQKALDGTRFNESDKSYITHNNSDHAKLWKQDGSVIDGKINASGAFVQIDSTGNPKLIVRADNSQIMAYSTQTDKDTNNHKTIDKIEEITADGHRSLWTKEGDKFVNRADNGNVIGERKDFALHQNGNVTFNDITKGKTDGNTIVRGDGTTILTGEGKPQYEFDTEGRFDKISAGNITRQYSYAGQTTKLDKITVQDNNRYPDLTFTHNRSQSGEWTATDNYGRAWSAYQGVHHLDQSTGQYTVENQIGNGYSQQRVFQTSHADGKTEFQRLTFNLDGTTSVKQFNSQGTVIGEHQANPKDKALNNLVTAWQDTQSIQNNPKSEHKHAELQSKKPQDTPTKEIAQKNNSPTTHETAVNQALQKLADIKINDEAKMEALRETEFEQAVRDRVNVYRSQYRLPPLQFDAATKIAAMVASTNQAQSGALGHYGGTQGWDSPAARLQQINRQSPFGYIENAYQGPADAVRAVDNWMASPGHVDCILNPNAQLIGVAYSGQFATMSVSRGEPIAPVLARNESSKDIQTVQNIRPEDQISHTHTVSHKETHELAKEVAKESDKQNTKSVDRSSYDDLIVTSQNSPPVAGFKEKVEAELDKQSDEVIAELRNRNTKIVLGHNLGALGFPGYEEYSGMTQYTLNKVYIACGSMPTHFEEEYIPRALNHELGHLLLNTGNEGSAEIYGAKMSGHAAYSNTTLEDQKQFQLLQNNGKFFNDIIGLINSKNYSRSPNGNRRGLFALNEKD